MIHQPIHQTLDQNGVLFRTQGFTYTVDPLTKNVQYISKRGKNLLTTMFEDLSNRELNSIFSSKVKDEEREAISKQFLNNDCDEVRIFSCEFSTREGILHAFLYEKITCIEMSGKNIEGIQGVCVIQDNALSIEDEMCYVRLMMKSQLVYSLVPIENAEEIEINTTTEKIVRIFEETLHFGTSNDCWLSKGRNVFSEQVKFFVSRSLPLLFTLPAFPCKSPNSTYKVLGKLPDKGEELAMKTLSDFCLSIQGIYPPGARIEITSDGLVFSDVFGVSDEQVATYDAQIKIMIPHLQRYITFQDLNSFIEYCKEISRRRLELIRFSGHTLKYWDDKIQNCEKTRRGYTIFKRVASEELFHFRALEPPSHKLFKPKDLSHSKIDTASKNAARMAMIRNDAYSTMVDELMPLHIRFSIHSYDNSGPKFSIKLLNSVCLNGEEFGPEDPIPTPWHNVIVESKEGKFTLMRKCRAERELGESKLVYYKAGWPSHYKE